ncbi:MAG: Lrp/AsnC family transcriptional regulator [archaeon]
MESLSQKDLLLISKLREDSRTKLTKLSRDTNVPVSTIFDKIKEYRSGVIKRFSCLIEFEKLGYPIKSQIILQVTQKDRDRLKKHLEFNENVNSLFKANNGNFLIEGIFKSIKHSEKFIETLQEKFEIINIQNFYVIEEIKHEGFSIVTQ